MNTHHTTLENAAVLGARNNFLAGITALFEIHPAHQLEVGHLRHKAVLRFRQDGDDAFANRESVPDLGADWFCRRCRVSGKRVPQGNAALGQGHDFKARRRQADQPRTVAMNTRHACRRQRAKHRMDTGFQGIGVIAGNTEAYPARIGVFKFYLGAQHEHLQALLDRGLQSARQLQEVSLAALPQQKRGQHTAFRRVPAVPLHRAFSQGQHIIAELIVQKAGGILARHENQAFMRQIADGEAGRCRMQFGGRVAKVRDASIVKLRTKAQQFGSPEWIHVLMIECFISIF